MIVNKVGLKKRESFNEIVNYIQTDKTKIKYPDRRATFLMKTNQFLSLLDTDGLEEQEQSIEKQKVATVLARNLASSNGETEALVRPKQLDLLETQSNASTFASEQRKQPSNLLSRIWRGAKGSSSSSGLIRTNTSEIKPIVIPRSSKPDIFTLFDNEDDIASEADDIDEFLDATDGERENKRAAAAEMGRQHLEEVHKQQPINSYLNKLYSKSNDIAENRKRKTEQIRNNDDQLTDEQKIKKAISNIGFKSHLQLKSWVAQTPKELEQQASLRDISLWMKYADSKVLKTKLQLAKELIEWDNTHASKKGKK